MSTEVIEAGKPSLGLYLRDLMRMHANLKVTWPTKGASWPVNRDHFDRIFSDIREDERGPYMLAIPGKFGLDVVSVNGTLYRKVGRRAVRKSAGCATLVNRDVWRPVTTETPA